MQKNDLHLLKIIVEERNVEILPGQSIEIMDKTFGKLSLVSEKYLQGYFQDAYNIICSIVPQQQHLQISRKMNMAVHDFAPFTNSADYCLHVNNDTEPLLCSNSKTFQTSYESFESTHGWQFSMSLKASAYYLPKVKFWVIITGN